MWLYSVAITRVLVALLLIVTNSSYAEISITLNNKFIEKFKNRATIDVEFVIDISKGAPNAASKDGDMHFAGRDAKNIGLPTVAELVNAKDHLDAVQIVNDAQGTNLPIKVSGAWRIWNEHGGDNQFIQGKKIAASTTSNPDHVFEIHPVVSIGNLSLHNSFKDIAGYTPKQAESAFPMYEQVRSTITAGNGKTTILSSGIGYNYVKFQMVLNEKPFKLMDGAVASASVQDLAGHLILRKKRMVFVKDTPPEVAVRDLGEGACLQVLGIPRIDLALVSWRVAHRTDVRKPLTWNLPYEIIVVGLYAEPCEED